MGVGGEEVYAKNDQKTQRPPMSNWQLLAEGGEDTELVIASHRKRRRRKRNGDAVEGGPPPPGAPPPWGHVELPPPWRMMHYFDGFGTLVYYVNDQTGESSWHPPPPPG